MTVDRDAAVGVGAYDLSPLGGRKVAVLGGRGPVNFCAEVLEELGAQVYHIRRPAEEGDVAFGLSAMEDRWIAVDLKSDGALDSILSITGGVDCVIEGLRPSAADGLGVGYARWVDVNPTILYASMSGWGHRGPRRNRAGHDINYIAEAGLLYSFGCAGRPPRPPLAVAGDLTAGLLLATALVAVMNDPGRAGPVHLSSSIFEAASFVARPFARLYESGIWRRDRDANVLDGSSPFYRCYETAEGKFLSVGALEPHFYAAFLGVIGLRTSDWPQHDRDRWPELSAKLELLFAERDLLSWLEAFESVDTCVSPVVPLWEASGSDHARSLELYRDGVARSPWTVLVGDGDGRA